MANKLGKSACQILMKRKIKPDFYSQLKTLVTHLVTIYKVTRTTKRIRTLTTIAQKAIKAPIGQKYWNMAERGDILNMSY